MTSTSARPSTRRLGRIRSRVLLVGIAAVVLAGALVSPGAAQSSAGDSTGVSPDEIKIGYIFSKTGLAGSTFEHAGDGFVARIEAQNAAGGVNGRKIVPVLVDDGGTTNNRQAAQSLVENDKVFAVVNNSPFAFLAYRYLLDSSVPMLGGGYDSNEYSVPGNEKLISLFGNTTQQFGAQYRGYTTAVLKKLGVANVGAIGYGGSESSTAGVENLQKYAVPAAGLKAAYTNTTVDFGTTDVGPIVLAMKNADVDGAFLNLVLSTNLAIIQSAAQNNLKFKAALLATGYGQALLDEPVSKTIGPEVLFSQSFAPVELKTAATKRFQSSLAKYTDYEGVPDFGVYTGYLAGDLLVKGLQAAGKNLTRDGYITATKGLGTWDGAGLSCQPIDVSAAGFGQQPKTICGWLLRIKDGKFVLYPSKKPIRGTLIESSLNGS